MYFHLRNKKVRKIEHFLLLSKFFRYFQFILNPINLQSSDSEVSLPININLYSFFFQKQFSFNLCLNSSQIDNLHQTSGVVLAQNWTVFFVVFVSFITFSRSVWTFLKQNWWKMRKLSMTHIHTHLDDKYFDNKSFKP